MRLGIMQPYFLPYVGYFSLIAACERFILLDTVQFIRHGWIERNRILKPMEGWQYIRVPLKAHHRETPIRDIRIDDSTSWRRRILAQLEHYRKSAPYYPEVSLWFESALSFETGSIVKLDQHLLRETCERLDIETPIEVFSELTVDIEPPAAPDEWALHICRALGGVTEYWNPIGGQNLFDRSKYEASGIRLLFMEQHLTPYDQQREQFTPALSMLDVMMFNGIDTTRSMFEAYELH